MVDYAQLLRAGTPGARPSNRLAGEVYTNWADKQLGVIDAAAAPMDLLAVRVFSTSASYAIGDYVVNAGQMYRAIAASTPGAFVPASWSAVGPTSFMAMPAGIGIDYWGSTAPAGTRFCDGSLLNETTFAALFAVIGRTYGGTAPNFALPDARGRVAAGKDNMGGTAASRLTNAGTGNPGIAGSTLGAAGGVDRHALVTAQLPSHEHMVTVSNSTTINNTGMGLTRSAATAAVTGFSNFTGGNEAHPNTQPTIVCNMLITTGGVA